MKYHNGFFKDAKRDEGEKEKDQETRDEGPVWYMCLKIENCCLKTFVEICVSEKMYEKKSNVV